MLRPSVLLVALLAGVSTQTAPVDLLILNARVYTGVPAAPWAEAIAISGERITRVGSNAELTSLKATRVVDAQGRVVIPGINDAHTHPSSYPPHTALEGPPAMTNDPSWAEILERVRAAVAKAPAGGWILGEIGGTVLEDAAATRAPLDAISGDRPVMLQAWHGHGAILNTAALRALKVSETEPDPPGGFYGRMADGKTLTGLAHEYALYGLTRRLSELSGAAATVAAYQRFGTTAASFGITSVQAMMVSYPAREAGPLFERAKLPIRVRVIDVPIGDPGGLAGCTTSSPMVQCSGVKYIVDGTPIERLMFTREPYADAPNTRGRLNFEAGRLPLGLMVSAKTQPMFHAVGDAAIDGVLSALERSSWLEMHTNVEPVAGASATPAPARMRVVYQPQWHSLRPRLEHGDMMEPGHFERAKELGVVLVQNPSHFMVAPVMKARLGERMSRVDMVKSVVRAGIPFAIGSDGPLNPFQNIMFATMNPANPAEALTVEEALVAYTHGSAYAELMETQKGRLAPGMLADLAILSQDIFKIPTVELPSTTSLFTVVGGRVVHEVK